MNDEESRAMSFRNPQFFTRNFSRFTSLSRTLLLLAMAWAECNSFAASSFTGLGVLPGYAFSSARGISGDGKVLVGFCESKRTYVDDRQQAFRWTAAGGMVGLGHLRGSTSSLANAASDDGSIVVGLSAWGPRAEAFRWTLPGGMVGLGCLRGGHESNSCAKAVSGDGKVVVGGSDSAEGVQAFRWTESGGMIGLGFVSRKHTTSFANGVSKDGMVIAGGSYSSPEGLAFRWTASKGMLSIGTLRGLPQGDGFAVSRDGSVVVGNCWKNGIQDPEWNVAFRWTVASGMFQLGDLPAPQCFSKAFAVSADGNIVVGSRKSAEGEEAFIWDNITGMRILRTVLMKNHHVDLTEWKLVEASGISADGKTIVGTGTHEKRNKREAWIAHLDESVKP